MAALLMNPLDYGFPSGPFMNALKLLDALVIFAGCLLVLGPKRMALHDLVVKTAVCHA
jgi:hypothetical protein